jgi:hypothetical protein
MIRDAVRQQHNRLDTLVQQLGSPNFRQREQAEAALRLSGGMAGPFLVDALGSGSAEVVRRATRLLNGLGDQAIPHLVRGLASQQEQTQNSAYSMLRALGPRAVPELIRGLGNEGTVGQRPIISLLRSRVNDIATSTRLGDSNLDDVAASQERGLTPRPRTNDEISRDRQAAATQLVAIERWMRDPANARQIAELQAIAGAGGQGGEAAEAARQLLDLPQKARLNLALLCAQELNQRWDHLSDREKQQLQRQAVTALTEALQHDGSLVGNQEFLAAMRFTGCGVQRVVVGPRLVGEETPREVQDLRALFTRLGGDDEEVWRASAPWRRR